MELLYVLSGTQLNWDSHFGGKYRNPLTGMQALGNQAVFTQATNMWHSKQVLTLTDSHCTDRERQKLSYKLFFFYRYDLFF